METRLCLIELCVTCFSVNCVKIVRIYSLACIILVNDFSVNLGVYSLVAIGTLFSIQKWGATQVEQQTHGHRKMGRNGVPRCSKVSNTPILEIQLKP